VAFHYKEFPARDRGSGRRQAMLADGVYPPSVDITPEALKVSMDTQIPLGNLTAQPDYKAFVVKKFIEPALAMK
jgi:NitT/TauT family transport system substrate-binding protein